MANKEFRNIDEFIEGFTREGPTPKDFNYDGVIWGMEFLYKNHIYRLTRDPIGLEKQLKAKFGNNKTAYIKLFEVPESQYPDAAVEDLNLFLGIYDDVYDLLDNGKIDNVPLRDIIASEETEILAID